MTILAIIGLVVMGMILGYACRGSERNCQHWDYDIKAGELASLQVKVLLLEQESFRLNSIVRAHGGLRKMFEENLYAHCYSCEKIFRGASLEDQEIADKLKSISLTSEEIAKKLGFDTIK